MSSRALGVVSLQGKWVWGEAVEISASPEVSERGMQGRATLTETFAFLLKRIAFLARCTNNTCH